MNRNVMITCALTGASDAIYVATDGNDANAGTSYHCTP